jgi:hypothetical protein
MPGCNPVFVAHRLKSRTPNPDFPIEIPERAIIAPHR